MGNCQAIDNASLVIQQPCGRVDKMYWPVPASDIMKLNPGYCVALLLTTTLYPPSAATTASVTPTNNEPIRVTRIKLLRPTDTLVLGHTYRLVTSQEVMKCLWAKKYSKMQKKQPEKTSGKEVNASTDFDIVSTSSLEKKAKQTIKHDRHRTKSKTTTPTTSSSTSAISSATVRPRGWNPSLQSISEATS